MPYIFGYNSRVLLQSRQSVLDISMENIQIIKGLDRYYTYQFKETVIDDSDAHSLEIRDECIVK